MEACVVKIVGDYCVGRTCLAGTYVIGNYPFVEYIPSVWDGDIKVIQVEKNRTMIVSVREDDGCGEDYWRLRPLGYPDADVFIALYSVDSRESFEDVKDRWIPELRDFCPKTPIVIVGNKIDLRKDGDCETVSYKEGLKMAKEMGTSYFEVCCIQNRGIDECFKVAIELAELNKKKMRRQFKGSATLIPPIKPLPDPKPVIATDTSTFADEWRKTMSDPEYHDIKFLLHCGRSILAHRLVLCSSSSLFRKIFFAKDFSKDDIEAGKVPGIQKIYRSTDEEEIIVELSSDVNTEAFYKLLELIYTRSFGDDAGSIDIPEINRTAEIFEMNQLDKETVQSQLNKLKNHGLCFVLKTTDLKEYLKKGALSDVVFSIEGSLIPAHKVAIYARCPKLAVLIDSAPVDKEGSKEVQIPDVSLKDFSILLEYIYTDSVDVHGTNDWIGLIVMAHKYGTHRLVTICERAIYDNELKTGKIFGETEKRNAIELLQSYKECKATQLVDWFRHYISHNFLFFFDDEKFSTLDVDDKNYVEDHRWPPMEYELKSQAFYEKLWDQSNRTRRCKIL